MELGNAGILWWWNAVYLVLRDLDNVRVRVDVRELEFWAVRRRWWRWRQDPLLHGSRGSGGEEAGSGGWCKNVGALLEREGEGRGVCMRHERTMH